jgi:O-antigen/teichoic acid export membrane protein
MSAATAGTETPHVKSDISNRRLIFSVGLRSSGSVLQFVAQVLIARCTGSAALGLYTVASSWVRTAGNLMALGMPQYAMRHIATFDSIGNDPTASRNLMARAVGAIAKVGLVGVLAVTVVVTVLERSGVAGAWFAIEAIAIGSALFALLRLGAEGLKARRRPEFALFIEYPAVPAGLGVAAVVLRSMRDVDRAHILLVAYVVLVGCCAALTLTRWFRDDGRRPAQDSEPVAVVDRHAFDRRSLATYSGIAFLNVATWGLPILFLPLIASLSEIARFSVAQSLMAIPAVFIVGLSGHFAPSFARARARHDGASLARELRRSQLIVGALFTVIVGAMLLAPGLILGVFGHSFRQATGLLEIMAVGQLINAWTGLSSDVLMMTGNERVELLSNILAIASMTVGMLVGAQVAGMTGVAFAYSFALAQRNLVSFWFARRAIAAVG